MRKLGMALALLCGLAVNAQAAPELTRRAAVVSDAGAVRYVLRPTLGSTWDAAAGGGKEAKMRHGA